MMQRDVVGSGVRGQRFARRGAWLALASGVAALAFWFGGRQASPGQPELAAAPRALEARLEELEGALALERAAREALAQELAELHAQLDAMTIQPFGGAPRPAAPDPELAAAATADEAGESSSPDAADSLAPLFDVEALVAGCMERPDAEALRARWERYQLDKIELNDRARRENYFMRPRHRREHWALDAAFRSELGDEGYDAYLRATGQPNRIVVREVLPGSAGSAAGLEVGDELALYAGAPVFAGGDLQRLTASGRLGEPVVVEVVRRGQPLTLRVTRGPLGVVLEGATREPPGDC